MSDPLPAPPELAAQLGTLGVEPGALVMVHASMRAVGPVAGGALGLIEALELATRPGGTLMMMIAADDDEPFDPRETRADPENGVLAEVFRTHPGVIVNAHPACRFAARGPLAEHLLEPQPWNDYYGPGSPLERFVESGGRVLRLGANVDTVTLTHHAEYIARVPAKRRITRHYTFADGRRIAVESLHDSAGIRDWRHGDYFGQILLDYLATGRAATGPVAGCRAELLDGVDYVDFAVAWLERELG